jgi:hypothetical protein
MTQDQYGQARDSGYVSGQVVEDDDTGEYADDQGKPMTRFQKVASALRGDKPDPTSQDPREYNTVPDVPDTMDQDVSAPVAPDPNGAAPDRTAAAGPSDPQGDYWDAPDARGAGQDPVVATTSPDVPVADSDADPLAGQADVGTADVPDHARTEPDMFRAGAPVGAGNPDVGVNDPGTYGHGTDDLGNGTQAPYADDQDQAGDETLPDVPVTQAPAGAVVTEPAAGPVVTEAPSGTAVTDAPGGPGRHAAAPAQDLRPGEATGTLDDLGDLAYGKLIPDAADFTAQWQQIQFKFVDDPRASVTEAAEVVSQVTAKMEAAIAERQRAIEESQRAIQEQQRSLHGRWGENSEADTETLRETLRMYKAFLDQLVGPKA